MIDEQSVERLQFETVKEENAVSSRMGLLLVVTAILFFIVGYGLAFVTLSLNNESQANLIEDHVRAAVSEAMGELDLSALVDAQQAEPEQPAAYIENVNLDDDPAFGPEDAPVTIVEFSDFRCGFCGRFHQDTYAQLIAEYEGQIRFVYRDFPVVGGALAAVAAECVDDQGLFWEYHDILFTNQALAGDDAGLTQLAEGLDGLDMEAFTTCLVNRETEQEIQNDYNDARVYGVTGTPTFFINGQRLVGAQPIQVFRSVIDEALAATQG